MRLHALLVPFAAVTAVVSPAASAAPSSGAAPVGAPAASAPASETRFLETDGGRLAYDDNGGRGPVVICVPGMGDVRGQYRFLAPRLAASGYRVITMDVRGHGESSVSWKEWDAVAVGRDVLSLMDSLGVEKAHLVGNSFAAGSVYWAAVHAPRRVTSLTLLDPAMHDGAPNPVMNLVVKVGLTGFWGPRFWMAYWDGLFPVRKPRDFAAYRAALLSNLSEPGRLAALKKMAFASKAPIDAILGQAKLPTLVVMGTKDKDFPDPAAEAAMLGARTGARVQMLETGHYPHVEAPEQTADIVLPFLGGR
jgi:pimeloyl-ACP methyl ester carboxylesterase